MLSRPLKYYIEMLGQIRRDFFRPDLSMSTGFRFPSGEHRNPIHLSSRNVRSSRALQLAMGLVHQVSASIQGAFDSEKEATIGEQAIKEVDDMFRSAGIQFDDQHVPTENKNRDDVEKEVYMRRTWNPWNHRRQHPPQRVMT